MTKQASLASIEEDFKKNLYAALGFRCLGENAQKLLSQAQKALKDAYDAGRCDAPPSETTQDLVVDLVHAAWIGDKQAVEDLLDKGADINAMDERADNYLGATALIAASKKGHIDIVRLLIGKGANLDAPNKYGSTPLIKALVAQNKKIARLLIEKGANVNAATSVKTTPLMFAVFVPLQKDIVRLLIEKGADVNAANKYGFTPIILAASHNQLAYVQLLVDAGANVNAKANDGATAIGLVYSLDCRTGEFLLQHGAREEDRHNHMGGEIIL